MVKLNLLLTLLGATALQTCAAMSVKPKKNYDGDCKIIQDFLNGKDASIDECIMNNNKNIETLYLKGESLTQDVINEIKKHKTIKELQFIRFGEISNLNMESLRINHVIFYDINTGKSTVKFKGNHVQPEVIKSLKNINHVTIEGYQISQDTINAVSTLPKTEIVNFDSCGYDKGLDFSILKNTKNLKTLVLDYYNHSNVQSLTEFPESLCQLKKLKNLSVVDQGITSIPKCVKNLKSLNSLDVSANELTDLPVELKKLTNLNTLILDFNAFESIPTLVGELTTLKNLDISNMKNKIINFPMIVCNLENLESLKIDDSDISEIPSCIQNLTKLKALSLSYNKLTSISSYILKLTNLENLNLHSNKITTIPSNIKNLKKLTELTINYNNISKIPDAIGKLTKLKKLWMYQNKITSIPDAMGNLKNIEEIHLDFNEITNLPESLSKLSKLKVLILMDNNINAVIPESYNNLKQLERLDLSFNVDIRGKTLTNPKLTLCEYNVVDNKTKDGICLAEGTVCVPYGDTFPDC